jgi:hypothetical protein
MLIRYRQTWIVSGVLIWLLLCASALSLVTHRDCERITAAPISNR